MIASILRIPGPPGDGNLFERFKSTKGVVQTYRLESTDGDPEELVVTIWDNEQSRAAFNAGAMRKEVDTKLGARGPSRRVYRILDSK